MWFASLIIVKLRVKSMSSALTDQGGFKICMSSYGHHNPSNKMFSWGCFLVMWSLLRLVELNWLRLDRTAHPSTGHVRVTFAGAPPVGWLCLRRTTRCFTFLKSSSWRPRGVPLLSPQCCLIPPALPHLRRRAFVLPSHGFTALWINPLFAANLGIWAFLACCASGKWNLIL